MINLDSRRNNLKQLLSDWVTMNKPATTDSYTSKYYTEYVITHDLGYRPIVRAWYDPTNSDHRYPMNGSRVGDNSYLYNNGIVDFHFYVYEITTTTVTFRADNYIVDGLFTGTFRFFYKIYADPSLGAI